MCVRAKRGAWPDSIGDYQVVDDDGHHLVWIYLHRFGPDTEAVAERILAAINGDTVPAPTLPDALLAERVAEGHLPTLAPEIGLHAIGRLYAADVQPIPDSHDVEWMRGRITLGVAVEPQSIPVRMGATYVIAQVVHP